MKKYHFILKKLLLGCAVVVVLLLLFLEITKPIAIAAVEEFLEKKMPQNVELSYQKLDVNLFEATITLEGMTFRFLKKDGLQEELTTSIERLRLENFRYINFFVKDQIQITNVLLERPNFMYYMSDKGDGTGGGKHKKRDIHLLKTIEVDNFQITEGTLTIIERKQNHSIGRLEQIEMQIKALKTDPKLINNKVPLTFDSYSMSSHNICFDLGRYERLEIGQFQLGNKHSYLENLTIKSKYTRNELSKILTKARDHIDLNISKVFLNNLDFGAKEQLFFVKTEEIQIKDPILAVYRDKRLSSTTDRKKLYSKMLREAPIQLDISKINIQDGSISYSERSEMTAALHPLYFSNFNTEITDVTNIKSQAKRTKIKLQTDFMDHAPLTIDWSFDSSSIRDEFLVLGTLQNFEAIKMNPFFMSNLRVKMKGMVHHLYFTISGSDKRATGDLKMAYTDFEFSVLKKDRLHINRFLSSVGNLLINNGNKTDSDGFRHGKISIERDRTKSFFNFLWKSIQGGVMDAMTGSGKK